MTINQPELDCAGKGKSTIFRLGNFTIYILIYILIYIYILIQILISVCSK